MPLAETRPAPGRADALDRGRAAFAAKAWGEAYATLSAADDQAPLDAADLERLATAARLTGRDAESADLWARAHQAWLGAGNEERAASVAAGLAIQLFLEGEQARSSGWLARARRLLDDGRRDCVALGYLLMPQALQTSFGGDPATSRGLFAEITAIGERFGDRDLAMMGRLGEGRSLIRLGETARGMALLDEVMVAATADELSPHVVGDIYCAVIDACQETYDVRRAQEWTAALVRWTASQPDVSPYRGSCLIRRAELLQLHGEWPDALGEATRACDCLAGPPVHRAIGAAWYRLAELHRLRGEAAEAEERYRQGSRWGRDPHPGLALLRLAQGRVDAAASAIRRVVAEATDPRRRAADLAACVEIMLAAGDTSAARAAAEELSRLAASLDAPFLRAVSAQAWARCSSASTSRGPRWRPCARLRPGGASSRRRTRWPRSGSSSDSRTAPSATRTRRRWSSTPRGTRSPGSGPRRTCGGRMRSCARLRRSRPRSRSPRARSRFSAWWRRDGPTGPWRRSWASARRPSPDT